MSCTHWTGGGYCGAAGTRMYLPGQRCAIHTPAALAGRPENLIDPALTLDGLRAAAGLTYSYRPTDSALMNDRAVARGQRRSTDQAYRLAQKATAKH